MSYECDNCGAEFVSIGPFKEHVLSDTACEKVKNKKFGCLNCDKKFTTEKSMKYHIKHSCANPMDNNNLLDIVIIKEKLKRFESVKEELEEAKQKLAETSVQIEELKTKVKRGPGRPRTKIVDDNKTINIEPIQNSIIDTNKEAIYLIHPKEYIDAKINIYKIGMTTRMVDNRLAQYEKDSNVLLTRNVNNAKVMEKLLLYEFNKKFKLVRGREYFQGNYLQMIDIINEKIKESVIKNIIKKEK
jgi:PHD/YefM family antitoxin component YafN of YafNO toxin-antitoxin module/DNA-directed RNA polymerase subunit RPC12/RpoP